MPSETFQKTMDELLLSIRAGYPVIYITSHEESRVLDCIARLYRVLKTTQPDKHLLHWRQGEGLREITNIKAAPLPRGPGGWLGVPGLPAATQEMPHLNPEARQALNSIRTANNINFARASDSVIVFFDIHFYLGIDTAFGAGEGLVRPLRNTAHELRRYYDAQMAEGTGRSKTIIIVSPPGIPVSPELEGDLFRVEFPLPEHDELQQALVAKEGLLPGQLQFPDSIPEVEIDAIRQDKQEYMPEDYKRRLRELIAAAGRGLTLEAYKLGLNKIAARREPLRMQHVTDMLDLKAKAISNRALTYTPNVKIELGGLEEIKDWVRIRQGAAVSEVVRKRFLLPPPRGVMLCGASGGGKSQLAKLIAMEFNLALLRLDVGSLFGSYVGQSEQYTREALEMAEVLAPVVLWIDEIDKAFKGMGSGGDNGVSARVFGYFLTWLSEKQDSVFVVVTANDFEDLLDRFPEFGRKGRFDQIFWVNLPSTESLSRIFSIYLQQSYEEGLLAVDDASVDALQIQTANEPRKVGGAFDRLCDVLSHPDLAEGLTGAEVEYAVTEAKYEIYSDTERLGGEHRLTPGLLTKVVGKAARGALYRPGTEDRLKLERLRGKAEANGWPIVS